MAIGLGFMPTDIAILLAGILIALLGIPHGSLDLHLMSTRAQRLRELAIYIVCIALVLGIWLVQPTLMLALFLINSAWHFGDCDIRSTTRIKPLLALVYGTSILMIQASVEFCRHYSGIPLIHLWWPSTASFDS